MVDWVRAGRDPEKFPDHQSDKDDWQPLLVIEKDGSISFYDRSRSPVRYEQERIAIGSGRDFAMAAMHLGKSAVEAVEVACALDSGCGNGIDALTFGSS